MRYNCAAERANAAATLFDEVSRPHATTRRNVSTSSSYCRARRQMLPPHRRARTNSVGNACVLPADGATSEVFADLLVLANELLDRCIGGR